MADPGDDKFSDLLELYEGVKKRNVWSKQDLDTLENIIGNTHPIDVSIRRMFQEAAAISGYGKSGQEQLMKLADTVIQSIPGKIGRFNRELSPRYNALNRTTPPTQLRKMHPDYLEMRPGSSVAKFYRYLGDESVLRQARATYGHSVSVLQYHIPRKLRQSNQSSGQYIKSIKNIIEFSTGIEVPLKVVNVIEDVDRINSGHVIVSL